MPTVAVVGSDFMASINASLVWSQTRPRPQLKCRLPVNRRRPCLQLGPRLRLRCPSGAAGAPKATQPTRFHGGLVCTVACESARRSRSHALTCATAGVFARADRAEVAFIPAPAPRRDSCADAVSLEVRRERGEVQAGRSDRRVHVASDAGNALQDHRHTADQHAGRRQSSSALHAKWARSFAQVFLASATSRSRGASSAGVAAGSRSRSSCAAVSAASGSIGPSCRRCSIARSSAARQPATRRRIASRLAAPGMRQR